MDELEPRDLATWEVDELSPDFERRVMARLEREVLTPRRGATLEPASAVADAVRPAGSRRRRWRGFAAAAVSVAAAVALTWGLTLRPPAESQPGAVVASGEPLYVELRPGVEAMVSPGGTLTWTVSDEVRAQQAQGLVRYEVTPGTAVAVRTPAGTIDVTGTTFSVEVLTMSDVSKLKSRSILTAGAAAATVLAIVVVHEGRVDAHNEHGAVEVGAGERAVMTDVSSPRALARDDESSQVARTRAPSRIRGRYASPEQRRQHAMVREKIAQALARRERSPAPASEPVEAAAEAVEAPRAPSGPPLDKEYVRETISEDLVPLARECYADVLSVDPEFGGKLVIEFDIMGDEDVGGIVDDVQPAEGTDVVHPDFIECIRESTMTVVFPPPDDGGIVHVSYPLVFAPG